MPAYDYECEACKEEMEIIHPMGTSKKKCPECGKLKLKRSWKMVAPYLARYSPLHPRMGRGKGNSGRRKS